MKLLIVILLRLVTAAEILKNIEPGVYQEEVGEVAFLGKEVEIWIKMDLEDLIKEIDLIDAIKTKMDDVCRNSTRDQFAFSFSCENIRKMSDTMVKNLKLDFEQMIPKRKKRAVDFIDLGIKILFGTIEYFDRKAFQEKLTILTDKTNDMSKFNFELTKLIEKSISKLNDTNEIINHHSDALETMDVKLLELENLANWLDRKIHQGFTHASLNTLFTAIYFSADNKIRDLHQTLIDLQSHVMNTKLITYEMIIEALKELRLKGETLKFPFELENPNLEVLRKLANYVVIQRDNDIIIVLSIPLVQEQMGTVQKFYSIPKLNDDIAEFLDSTNSWIIADNKKSKFIELNDENFRRNCIKESASFYCKNLNVWRREENSCTGRILLKYLDNIDKICGEKVLKIDKTLLISTEQPNKYLVVTPHPMFGNLVKGDGNRLLEFTGTQLFNVEDKATLILGNLEIQFYGKNEKIETVLSNFKAWNLSLDQVHSEKYETPTVTGIKIMKVGEISDLAENVKNLKIIQAKMINEEKNSKTLITFWIILAVLGALILFLGISFLYMKNKIGKVFIVNKVNKETVIRTAPPSRRNISRI